MTDDVSVHQPLPPPSKAQAPTTVDEAEEGTNDNMSPGYKEMLAKVRLIVPPLLEKFHKGAFL